MILFLRWTSSSVSYSSVSLYSDSVSLLIIICLRFLTLSILNSVQMSDEEDLNISDQYQSDDYESELEDSFESLEHDDENTEFVELDDSFTE